MAGHQEASQQQKPQMVWAGQHLSMHTRGHWEFATRNTARPAVGIVAITNDERLVLVEQYRPPVDRLVLELPAGLVGDIQGAEDESLVIAARRELLEETGYEAGRWTRLGAGFSSPGLTDESIVMFLAEDLNKVGPGGGDARESIRIHEVPWNEVHDWLLRNDAELDLKLLAAIYLAECQRRQ